MLSGGYAQLLKTLCLDPLESCAPRTTSGTEGKVLGWWYAPEACHGDMLLELANRWAEVLNCAQLPVEAAKSLADPLSRWGMEHPAEVIGWLNPGKG